MASNIESIDKVHLEGKVGENKDNDYLDEYRKFYEKFANIGESSDQLPVKVVGCLTLSENEIPGEILSYTLQYLDSIECPPGLITHICREVLEDTKKTFQNDTCNVSSLSLMKAAVSSVHRCLQAGLDNEKACRLSKPPEAPRSTASASRNGLRCMEDRHVALDDLNSLLDAPTSEACSFYAVYDGHSGPLAAAYSAAQLHMHFINSDLYKSNPQYALKEAFIKTDSQFGSKKSMGGTTAVVCYLKGNNLLVGWAGDSQALLVGDGSLIQLVNPHKPSREDEHKRIVQLGGQVVFDSIWRVNGILAVSRAIGDTVMKPYVTSEPEFASVRLSGFEEFLVIACDGLWDYVTEDEVALEVYKAIEKYPDDIKKISDQLIKVAKLKRSSDNISVIVVFLQDLNKLAEKARWLLKKFATMDASFDNTGGAQNRFHVNSSQDNPFSKEGLMFDIDTGFKKQNGDDSEPDLDPFSKPTNGKSLTHDFDNEMNEEEDDEDLGPETDVDAVDDIIMSPSLAAARALSQGSGAACNEIVDMLDGIGAQRQETPTPPVDGEIDAEFGGAGLVENVGESGGEDSEEDEWNYFKGDKKEKLANCEDTQQSYPDNREDIMSSPLNPDAPPFVPVVPGNMDASLPQRLFSEEVVSQSPQKPVPMDDIKVPEQQEFDSEISHRLADLGDDIEYHNGHSDNSAMSSQENLKETLQGNEKQLAELNLSDGEPVDMQFSGATNEPIVDQAEFERVQKDTTDFCDIQVTYNQQAGQPLDDEGIDEELYERLKSKERDPMSMSFYQEKDLDTCEQGQNPFDINACQTVSNDLEEFCNDKPQPEIPPAFDANPFLDNLEHSDVTQSEIHAAISDLDNAVTLESDSMDSIVKAPSPLVFEKGDMELPEVKELQSPISDNVSQLTEPSEHGLIEQNDLLNVDDNEAGVLSHDSAYSADAPSPVSSPMEPEHDLCHISEQVPVLQPEVVASAPEVVASALEVVASAPEVVSSAPEFIAQDEPMMSEPNEMFDYMSQAPIDNPIDIAQNTGTQLENIVTHEVVDTNMEFSSEVTEKVPFEQETASFEYNYQEEATQHQNAFEYKEESIPQHDVYEPEHMGSKVEEEICNFEAAHVEAENTFDQYHHDEPNIIPEPQHIPEQIEANIIDFRNDLIENNVTNDTSHTQVIEDIISQKNVENIESFKTEFLIDTAVAETELIKLIPEVEQIEPVVNIPSEPIQLIEETKTEPEPLVSQETENIIPVASAVISSVVGAGIVAATATTEDKKLPSKPKTTSSTAKKAPATKPLSSPTKPAAPKTATSSTTAAKKPSSAPAKTVSVTKTTSTSAAPKSAPAKPKPTPAPITKAPATKPATSAAAKKPTTTPTTEKKPLTNGDVKKEPVKKAAPLSKPAATKAAVPKTTSTVPAKTSPTTAKPTGVTSAAPRAPISRTAAPRPATAPAAPKPRPAPISKAPLSKPTSAVSKTTTTVEKSVKETTNKQLSARPTPAPRTAVPKSDVKPTSRTTTKTTTTTSTTTKPLPIKRPTSATTKSSTTTKSSSKSTTTNVKTTVVTSEKLNGSVEKCVKEMNETQEIITNGTDIPLKDDSPQQIDNSLVPIIDAAAD